MAKKETRIGLGASGDKLKACIQPAAGGVGSKARMDFTSSGTSKFRLGKIRAVAKHSRVKLMLRCIEPEILDTLRADDPAARRSRRELRLINAIMGNHRFLAGEVRRSIQPGWRVLELGAGDGTFGKRLVSQGICQAAQISGLDLAPRPADWPQDSAWVQGDIFAAPLPEAEVVIANLFLHHFEDKALAHLGKKLPANCRIFLASEPARRRLHLAQSALLTVLALLSHVTRHDMRTSIRAGFLGEELPRALGLGGWQWKIAATFLGAYRMCAVRA